MSDRTKKILIVEDEKPVARTFELKLVNGGFETKVVSDGEEALAVLAKEEFDLVFLDIIMPKMSGFRVLEELKARGNVTPVVITSSLRQDTDKEYALSLGARDYFVKSDVAIANIVEYAKKLLNG